MSHILKITPELRARLMHADTIEIDVGGSADELNQLRAKAAALQLEAEIHAQEARTANATIAEIYQLVTGATGEPGNWNGAEPVRQKLAELGRQVAVGRRAVEKLLEYQFGKMVTWDGDADIHICLECHGVECHTDDCEWGTILRDAGGGK